MRPDNQNGIIFKLDTEYLNIPVHISQLDWTMDLIITGYLMYYNPPPNLSVLFEK